MSTLEVFNATGGKMRFEEQVTIYLMFQAALKYYLAWITPKRVQMRKSAEKSLYIIVVQILSENIPDFVREFFIRLKVGGLVFCVPAFY